MTPLNTDSMFHIVLLFSLLAITDGLISSLDNSETLAKDLSAPRRNERAAIAEKKHTARIRQAAALPVDGLALPQCGGGGPGDKDVNIVAFSDIHGKTYDKSEGTKWGTFTAGNKNLDDFKESKMAEAIAQSDADLIIYAGDMATTKDVSKPNLKCSKDMYEQIHSFLTWFATIKPGTPKVIIGGNHDDCLDEAKTLPGESHGFRAQLLKLLKDKGITSTALKKSLGWSDTGLVDDSKAWTGHTATVSQMFDTQRVTITKHSGAKVTLELLLSSISEGRDNKEGLTQMSWWEFGAYQYGSKSTESYSKVATEMEGLKGKKPDILVMHGPPDNFGADFLRESATTVGKSAGFRMRTAVQDIAPSMMIFGHLHRGSQDVKLDRGYAKLGAIPTFNVAVKRERPEDEENKPAFDEYLYGIRYNSVTKTSCVYELPGLPDL